MKYPFNQEWTLFLDRDGVINKRLPGQYIQDWAQFEFEENSLAKNAFANLAVAMLASAMFVFANVAVANLA